VGLRRSTCTISSEKLIMYFNVLMAGDKKLKALLLIEAPDQKHTPIYRRPEKWLSCCSSVLK